MDYVELSDAYSTQTIQLEPRLQEYIRRKIFNAENDIEPPIPVEKEFCITEHDLKMIKRHKQGRNAKLYTSEKISKSPHFTKTETLNMDSAFKDFKKDPRYQRVLNKMESHKAAQRKIRNLEGIDEDYKIFHQSNPYDMRPDKRPTKIAKPYNTPDDDDLSIDDDDTSFMMDSRDFVARQKQSVKRNEYCYNPNRQSNNPNTYHHSPKISFKQLVTPYQVNGGLEHRQNLNDIIGNLDRYNKHLDSTYDYIQSDADLDTHTFTPGTRTKTQREMQTSYQSIPFMYGNGLPDVSIENSLRGTNRDSSKKSIGFRNPFEHQFDYISPDISSPNHTVQMWPQNTRGSNKEIARPKSGAIQSDKRLRNVHY